MKFTYCPHCGEKLIEKEIGDEGKIPYCEKCKLPMFELFPVCIIALVYDKDENILMLKQKYLSNEHYGLISGYMKTGETAEVTAHREILEETGIRVRNLKFAGTYYLAKKQMLMIAFTAEAKNTDLTLSKEVDEAIWQKKERAFDISYPKGSVSYALIQTFIQMTK